jgi:Tfp pilus assembly protein PilO
MKQLSDTKRNQLLLTLLVSATLICMVYFFLILPQTDANKQLANEIKTAHDKLELFRTTIKQATATGENLKDVINKLNEAEQDVANGDVSAWTYDTLRGFKSAYRSVDIPNMIQPSQSDVDLIYNFPYKQLKVTLNGIAFYHDLGKFISELENKFPHMRVLNLSIEPAEGEHLIFHMDVAALVKPNS